MKLLASQPGNYQQLLAQSVMENLLQAHPQIDGVLAANDAMAMGAVEALDGANRKALVIGINGTKEAIDAIKTGKLLATGDYNGFAQGCIGTMVAIRTLWHEPIVTELVLKPVVVDKTNYQPYDVPLESRTCPKWEDVPALGAHGNLTDVCTTSSGSRVLDLNRHQLGAAQRAGEAEQSSTWAVASAASQAAVGRASRGPDGSPTRHRHHGTQLARQTWSGIAAGLAAVLNQDG